MKKIHKHAEKSCGACYNNLYAREGETGMETKERTEGRLRRLLEQPGTFLKWMLFAGVIGLVAGGVSTAFYYALNAVTALREANPWLLWLLPLGGVAIVLLYRICGMEKDRGTNFVLVAVRENQPLRLRTAPLIFAGTVLTAPSPPRSDGGCTWTTRTAVSSPCAACPPPSPPSSALR